MLGGEDWSDIMLDAMNLEDCYLVTRDITVTVGTGAGAKQVWRRQGRGTGLFVPVSSR